METLVSEPLLPPPVIAALWVLAVAAPLAYVIWRPARIGWLRRAVLAVAHFVPLAFLVVLLSGPTWVRISGGENLRPVLAVFVDTSASMSAEDAGSGRTRFAAAAQAVDANFYRWNKDFDVRLYGFDKTVQPFSTPRVLTAALPIGTMTDIAGAIESQARAQPRPALALLLSDGGHNAAESDLAAAGRGARAAEIPVFSCVIGSNLTARDLGVTLSSAEELAFIKQRIRVPVMVTQTGYDNSEVEVELHQNGQTLETRKARFEGAAPNVLLDFHVSRDTAGVYPFEIVVPPRPGEALTSNNRRRFSLRVVDERIRILLLEGKPYWDSKFLERVLSRDPNVQLTSVTMMRKDRAVVEPPASLASTSSEKQKEAGKESTPGAGAWLGPRDNARPLEDRRFLAQYQVVMLGRETESFMSETAIENLRDWIANSGGHLICTRGRPTPESRLAPAVGAILPVAWKAGSEKKLRVRLTERGRAMGLFDAAKKGSDAPPQDDPDVIFNLLPSLVTATAVDHERALSVVLARAQDAPTGQEPMAMLSMQTYGAGKSVVLEGQGMWRWAFRPPEDKLNAEEFFRTFWANMIRWLAGSNEFLPSQDMSLRAGKPLYSAGEHPVLYVMMREAETPAAEGAAKGDTPPASLPKIEILREDANGNIDHAFTRLRVSAQPLPRESRMFRAELDTLEEGQYRAHLVDAQRPAEVSFEVLPPLKEKLDLRARPALLDQFSRMTDARILNQDELGSLGSIFGDYIRRHNPGREIKEPAWDRPSVWLLLMVWLALTWWTRRHWGAI